MKNPPLHLLPFLWYVLKPNLKGFLIVMILGIIAVTQFSLQPYFMGRLIDGLHTATQENLPLFKSVTPILILMSSLMCVGAICRRSQAFVNNRYTRDLSHYAVMQVYRYTSGHSIDYFEGEFAGRLGNKVMEIPRNLREFSNTFFNNGLTTAMMILIAFIVMGSTEPVFLLLLITWLTLVIGSAIWTARHVQDYSSAFQEKHANMTGRLVDILGNMGVIAAFARRKYEEKLFEKSVDELDEAFIREEDFIAKFYVIQAIAYVFILQGTAILGAYGYDQGWLSLGDFAGLMPLTLLIANNAWVMAEALIRMHHNLGTIQSALQTLIQPHHTTDHADASALHVSQGHIRLKDVTFGYNNETHIFENLSLDIPAGTRIGLVGPSGSGKSTFVKLLLRFYDAQQGTICIDGQNVQDVTQHSLRSNIAMIPQDTALFHRSLRENIRYGRLDATDEEVEQAAHQAHAHEFIKSLPDGYDTLVGERGVKLSGGQRQRIAIARAILKDAPILILDEATSALDSVSEDHIQKDLGQIMQGRTVIAIAHRLSTLSHMDRLLVFDQGRIVEDGTHEELLAQKGAYAQLWEMQVGGFLP